MEQEIFLTEPQEEFVFSEATYPAFVGGFGAGKTESGLHRAFKLALEHKGVVGFYEPTYDLLRTGIFGRVEAMAEKLKLRGKLNKSDNTFTFFQGGKLLFKSMEDPSRIINYQLTDAVLDELDTLPRDKAWEVFTRVDSRCRIKKADGTKNSVSVTTTPEGYRLVYELWGVDPKPGFHLIKAPTSSNPTLPDDYVPKLMAIYPPQLLAAYLEGEFTNLLSGSVYPGFDRVLNHTDETIIGPSNGNQGEHLHIGMDFNVNNMTAVVFVMRNGEPRALREFTKIADTPSMCQKLRETFPGHTMFVYPDASGQAGSTKDASNSDLQILKNAGFQLRLKPGNSGGYYNPKVKDRVAAMNAQILDGMGRRKLKVNTRLCPTFAECLTQQVYAKDGTPDKTGGKDHANDAGGYFIAHMFPVIKPVATRQTHIPIMGR